LLNPSDIENKSFEIITSIMNNRGTRNRYNDVEWEVVKRVVHTTGDPRIGEAVTFSENFYEHFLKAIATSRIVTDVNMVLSGISKVKFPDFSYECYISDQDIAERAKKLGVSRSYLCMEHALSQGDALFVIGNAPTALRRLLEGPSPSFIIGVPVGFVGASEWKAKLIYSDVPHISISGSHGGSTIAAAITNALLKYTSFEFLKQFIKREGNKG
jgi:precorrin-8X/cobalt-precorrin-8 methylmutase